MKVKHGFWMGRTEVTVGQFKKFVEATGFVTDAEKPGGKTQCFNPKWTHYNLTTKVTPPLGTDGREELARPQFPVSHARRVPRRLRELVRRAGVWRVADQARTRRRTPAGRDGVPPADRGRVGIRLSRR